VNAATAAMLRRKTPHRAKSLRGNVFTAVNGYMSEISVGCWNNADSWLLGFHPVV
jgi:hypothetical protein